ncbi:hypothetical protein DOY81_007551 [Sarcophaga bullata]|nr:hypothetical protein DOY81_007551 [Sarcophaga bullata]
MRCGFLACITINAKFTPVSFPFSRLINKRDGPPSTVSLASSARLRFAVFQQQRLQQHNKVG